MDDSQNSDFLSESTDIFCNSPTDPTTMDTVTYDSLVSSTKMTFSRIRNEIKTSTFSTFFSTLLEDCGACISQSLELVMDLLLDPEVHPMNLIGYLNNAVCLLQSLSDCIKIVIESVSMTCSSLKKFPTATGHIIRTVFTHCKDSESLYRSHLKNVEKQLKDLFRTCHELQLTYLMALEKHFIFDLTENEEQDILIEAMEINLKIGDIVQCLDVKTMAEQWKAYTMICEKYADSLMDKNVYDECTGMLCTMVLKNMRTALEVNQEERIIVRSLKVSSFTLKILLRICNIFKRHEKKDYEHVLELLLYIYLNTYLANTIQKTPEFINLYNNNILSSANCLLAELVTDEKFLNCVCNVDVNKIHNEDKLLGVILLVLAMIKVLLQQTDGDSMKFYKHKFVDCIYRFLPNGHVWFNLDFKFKLGGQHTCGLYEHLLTHTIALVATMSTDEFNSLEKRMVEAILSTECYSAMFSSNLWTLLARMFNRQLLLNQVVSLCKMYQQLDNNNLFADSPPQTHLAFTISRLFQTMSYEDKIKVYSLFNVQEDKNITLWVVLKISNLPKEIQSNAEEIVLDKFKMQFQKFLSRGNVDINDVIKAMNLASTCRFMNSDAEIETLVVRAWAKVCPRNNSHVVEILNKQTEWYYNFVKALVLLTMPMHNIFKSNSAHFVKVLHAVSNIIQSGSIEIKLLLITFLCEFSNCETRDMNKHLAESILTEIFAELFRDENIIVTNKLFSEVRRHANNNLDRIISKVVNEDNLLRETWIHFSKYDTLNKKPVDLKQHLLATMEYKHCHKCIVNGEEVKLEESLSLRKSTSDNFEFADIDTLFGTESDAEPVSKKVKLNTDDVVDEIISRLESDTKSLCKIKENIRNVEYQKRIKKICNKLANILE